MKVKCIVILENVCQIDLMNIMQQIGIQLLNF
jgi:hypothetical protein